MSLLAHDYSLSIDTRGYPHPLKKSPFLLFGVRSVGRQRDMGIKFRASLSKRIVIRSQYE